MTTAPATAPAGPGRAGFHPLVVSRVDPLCDDAVAVTFEVPPDARETFVFLPGQSLAVRRDIDGLEQRRTYSICSPSGGGPPPAGGAPRARGGVLRLAGRRLPAG